jgi:hypothetical protein
MQVTRDEIVAVARGTADKASARHVLALSLIDDSVAVQLAHQEGRIPAGGDNGFDGRARQLRERMMASVGTVAMELVDSALSAAYDRARTSEGRGAAAWSIPASLLDRFVGETRGRIDRVVSLASHSIALPCLAPATAAVADLSVRRETVTTEDVRIEFQQLPGEPSRLRVLLDVAENSVGYDLAQVVLEEGDRLPDRHILFVALNSDGLGYMDFQIGGDAGPAILPSPSGAWRLVGVTLKRLGRI